MSEHQDVRESLRKEFEGVVTSNKMNKTIVVEVSRLVKHAEYGKTIKRKLKVKAHDEKNEANIGDMVRINETRPYSRDKRWRMVEIVRKARSVEKQNDL
ncbi:MAG: 30S ribosomal protein S17 [Candidatus Omnitrophota bacterium]